MDKEQLLIELSNLAPLIPENLDFQSTLDRINELSRVIISTEEELARALNEQDGVLEPYNPNLAFKELQLTEEQNALRERETMLLSFEQSISTSRSSISEEEARLRELRGLNERVDTSIAAISDNSPFNSERIATLQNAKNQREEEISRREARLQRRTDRLNELTANSDALKGEILNSKTRIESIELELNDIRNEQVVLTSDDLNSKLSFLRHEFNNLILNPRVEFERTLNDYRNDLIDESGLRRGLEALNIKSNISNTRKLSKERELEEIGRIKEELEASIRRDRGILSGAIIPEVENREELEVLRVINELNIENDLDEQKHVRNSKTIKLNETSINEMFKEIKRNEDFLNEMHRKNIITQDDKEKIKASEDTIKAMDSRIKDFRRSNEIVKNDNKRIEETRSQREQKIIEMQVHLTQLQTRPKVNRSDKKYVENELHKNQMYLESLNLREKFLTDSIVDRINNVIQKTYDVRRTQSNNSWDIPAPILGYQTEDEPEIDGNNQNEMLAEDPNIDSKKYNIMTLPFRGYRFREAPEELRSKMQTLYDKFIKSKAMKIALKVSLILAAAIALCVYVKSIDSTSIPPAITDYRDKDPYPNGEDIIGKSQWTISDYRDKDPYPNGEDINPGLHTPQEAPSSSNGNGGSEGTGGGSTEEGTQLENNTGGAGNDGGNSNEGGGNNGGSTETNTSYILNNDPSNNKVDSVILSESNIQIFPDGKAHIVINGYEYTVDNAADIKQNADGTVTVSNIDSGVIDAIEKARELVEGYVPTGDEQTLEEAIDTGLTPEETAQAAAAADDAFTDWLALLNGENGVTVTPVSPETPEGPGR